MQPGSSGVGALAGSTDVAGTMGDAGQLDAASAAGGTASQAGGAGTLPPKSGAGGSAAAGHPATAGRAAVAGASGAAGASGVGGNAGQPSAAGTGGNAGQQACAGMICSGVCVDPNSDAKHCGTCNHACSTGYACLESACGNDIVDVASTNYTACALLHNGEAWCWGGNQLGQLGNGTRTGMTCAGITMGGKAQPGACNPMPAPVLDDTGQRLRDIVQLSGAINHVCAVLKDGSVVCWGQNTFGQLGHNPGEQADQSCTDYSGTMGFCNPVPLAVTGLGVKNAVQVACGNEYTCVRTRSAELYCWGHNDNGQLGISLTDPALAADTHATATPQRVVLGTGATQLSLGIQADTSCALLSDGSVQCWGGLANGPTPTTFATAQRSVTTGRLWACSGQLQGGVACWGINGWGVLGQNPADVMAAGTATTVMGLPAAQFALSGGDFAVLALSTAGELWSWGRNNYGSVGDGKFSDDGCMDQACVFHPYHLTQLHAKAVSLRSVSAVALDDQGYVWTWGNNTYAQLGHMPGTNADVGDTTCGLGSGRANEFCNPAPVKLAWKP